MHPSIPLLIASLIYTILIFVLFCKKEKVKTVENKIYFSLLITVIIGIILDICGIYCHLYLPDNSFIRWFVVKLYLAYLLVFVYLITTYVVLISYHKEMTLTKEKEQSKKVKRILNTLNIILAISLILNFVLTFTYYKEGNQVYLFGSNTIYVYGISALGILSWIYFVIKNRKNISIKKIVPIMLFVVFCVPVILLQLSNPQILVVTSLTAFLVNFMYHTIENPDTQIIDLLTRNKELTEKSVNEKSNFLFKISQELRKPIKDISKDINLLKDENNKEIEKELIEQIDNNAKCANFIINNITDISSMDIKNSNIKEDNYNIKRLFKDIELSTNNNLKNNNKDSKIKFTIKENTSYPETVYGDKIKLKQIIMSVINNSIKYTDNGHIDLEIDAIVRYDMCRFIFTITDTGIGMDIIKVNKLLSKEEELKDNIIEENNLNLSIPIVKKLLKIVGGNINITSKENKGTTVTLVINQEINYDSTGLILKDINNYSNPKRKLRVLLVDNNDELERVEKILDERDIDKVVTLFGQDCIDKIEHNEEYDLIIIKDELKEETAYEILNKLKQIPKFKTPVIIAIDKEKEFIKDHFIKDGFKDCIILNDDKKALEKTLNKYI